MLFGVFRFHIDATGRERLPRGGYLLIGAAHRGWMDPFVVMHALPEQPRLVPGQRPIHVHLPLARVADPPPRRPAAGMARRDRRRESCRGRPRGHPQRRGVRPDARGDGQRAGRQDRPVPDRCRADRPAHRRPDRPAAIAGTEELYVGRRLASRILPPTTPRELLGDAWDGTLPPEGSREELALARRLTERFEALLGPEVEALYPGTMTRPSSAGGSASGSTWLLLRPGLDRDEAGAGLYVMMP